jgi:aspartyl-tRNA(Asn)/glutamyl-tRNA(Gln) amidotransferase subunit A
LVLAAIAGADPEDPTALTQRFTAPTVPAARRYRVAVLRGSLDRTQPEVRRNFEDSLAALERFADLTGEVDLPDYPYDAMAGVVVDAEAASAFEPLSGSGRLTRLAAPEDRIGGYAGQVVLAKDYLRALRLRRPAAAALDRLLAGVDAIATPTLPTVAWPLDVAPEQAYPEFPGGASIAGAANLCGAPALFLMNGRGEGGLPTSLQLTARGRGEASLLAIGMEYQRRTGHHRLRPPGL